MHIRKMAGSDLDQVLMIEQVSFPAPWRREHFLHEISAQYSFPFVAEADGRIAGYVCLMALLDEAQILDIAVAPEMRGRGVAVALVEHSISLARELGASLIALEVRESNSAAIALYERLGFVRSGLRKKYYEGRENALLMEKSTDKEQPCNLLP